MVFYCHCVRLRILFYYNTLYYGILVHTYRRCLTSFSPMLPYALTTGVVLHYFLLNITLWWFVHVCSTFWKIQFPLHARRHKTKQKYAHVVLVVLCLFVPLPGVIATLVTDGYAINRFPPLLCGSTNPKVQYYSLWLVINILVAVGITLVTLMFWKVHKVYIYTVLLYTLWGFIHVCTSICPVRLHGTGYSVS